MDLDHLPTPLRTLVLALWEEDEHEITPAFLAALAALAGDPQTLAGYLCQLISFENRISVDLLNEAAGFSWHASKHEAAKVCLRGELLRTLESAGLREVKAAGYRVAVESSPPLVQIDAAVAELEAADPRFVRVRREWDLAALLTAYRSGESLPPGVSVTRTRYPKLIPLSPPPASP